MNTKLVAILTAAMASGLGAIVKAENVLITALEKAWHDFITSKDGSAEHWTYFDESGAVKRHGVMEFRDAVKVAAERGGYHPMYVASFLPSVDPAFVLRKREKNSSKVGTVKKVKFSEGQLAKIEAVSKKLSLTKESIKALLAELMA